MLLKKWFQGSHLVLILVIAVSVLGMGVQNAQANVQTRVKAIEYGNCSHLYAVQPGDDLGDIARVSATTEDFVLSRNDLDDADDIYPGLVLCLETADDGGGIIPPTGGPRSGVEVTNVVTDRSVTVRGMNFPSGTSMNVYIFNRGTSNPNVSQLGDLTIPESGDFERTYQIPSDLRFYRNLVIRFRNPDENVSASTGFVNANVDRITPEECAEYYTVRSGDVLSVIAQEQNVSVDQLVSINNLYDANVVFPGQMLCLERE
jgi:hypothetical protein